MIKKDHYRQQHQMARDNMSAAKYDLEIDQGSSFSIAVTVSDEGGARNLSAYTPRAQMRPAVDSPDADKVDFTFDVTSMASGIVVMQLAHDVSSEMQAGAYVYDLEIFTGTTGQETSVTRLMQGNVIINPEVTK